MHVDNGIEYISEEVNKYFRNRDIYLELTPPNSSDLNGKSERINRTLLDKGIPYTN